MPELKCSVQTCAHNKNEYCALDTIEVGGEKAKYPEETCCHSFVERLGNPYSNSSAYASPQCSIYCKADNCMYNDHCRCDAGKITVKGSGACQCKDTECATFCR